MSKALDLAWNKHVRLVWLTFLIMICLTFAKLKMGGVYVDFLFCFWLRNHAEMCLMNEEHKASV